MKSYHIVFIGLFITTLRIKFGIPSYSSLLVIAIKRKAKYVSRGYHIITLRSKNIAFIKGKAIPVTGREGP
jgi:hypothetical protein